MAGIYNLLCLTIIAVFTSVTAQDYCNLQSCTYGGNRRHTMCQYTSSTPAAACGQVTKIGFTDAEKNRIVNIHNQMRQKVASGQETRGNPGPQPPAVRMPNLTWDSELETIAQRWTYQCIFGHDQCRDVDRFQVGQNAALSYSLETTLETLVQMWYDEVTKMNRNEVSNYRFDPQIGHYSQLVWADTTKIGCGLMKYTESNGSEKQLFICNYGPTGNWQGKAIYEVRK